jgi:hypothetical protein
MTPRPPRISRSEPIPGNFSSRNACYKKIIFPNKLNGTELKTPTSESADIAFPSYLQANAGIVATLN